MSHGASESKADVVVRLSTDAIYQLEHDFLLPACKRHKVSQYAPPPVIATIMTISPSELPNPPPVLRAWPKDDPSFLESFFSKADNQHIRKLARLLDTPLPDARAQLQKLGISTQWDLRGLLNHLLDQKTEDQVLHAFHEADEKNKHTIAETINRISDADIAAIFKKAGFSFEAEGPWSQSAVVAVIKKSLIAVLSTPIVDPDSSAEIPAGFDPAQAWQTLRAQYRLQEQGHAGAAAVAPRGPTPCLSMRDRSRLKASIEVMCQTSQKERGGITETREGGKIKRTWPTLTAAEGGMTFLTRALSFGTASEALGSGARVDITARAQAIATMQEAHLENIVPLQAQAVLNHQAALKILTLPPTAPEALACLAAFDLAYQAEIDRVTNAINRIPDEEIASLFTEAGFEFLEDSGSPYSQAQIVRKSREILIETHTKIINIDPNSDQNAVRIINTGVVTKQSPEERISFIQNQFNFGMISEEWKMTCAQSTMGGDGSLREYVAYVTPGLMARYAFLSKQFPEENHNPDKEEENRNKTDQLNAQLKELEDFALRLLSALEGEPLTTLYAQFLMSLFEFNLSDDIEGLTPAASRARALAQKIIEEYSDRVDPSLLHRQLGDAQFTVFCCKILGYYGQQNPSLAKQFSAWYAQQALLPLSTLAGSISAYLQLGAGLPDKDAIVYPTRFALLFLTALAELPEEQAAQFSKLCAPYFDDSHLKTLFSAIPNSDAKLFLKYFFRVLAGLDENQSKLFIRKYLDRSSLFKKSIHAFLKHLPQKYAELFVAEYLQKEGNVSLLFQNLASISPTLETFHENYTMILKHLPSDEAKLFLAEYLQQKGNASFLFQNLVSISPTVEAFHENYINVLKHLSNEEAKQFSQAYLTAMCRTNSPVQKIMAERSANSYISLTLTDKSVPPQHGDIITAIKMKIQDDPKITQQCEALQPKKRWFARPSFWLAAATSVLGVALIASGVGALAGVGVLVGTWLSISATAATAVTATVAAATPLLVEAAVVKGPSWYEKWFKPEPSAFIGEDSLINQIQKRNQEPLQAAVPVASPEGVPAASAARAVDVTPPPATPVKERTHSFDRTPSRRTRVRRNSLDSVRSLRSMPNVVEGPGSAASSTTGRSPARAAPYTPIAAPGQPASGSTESKPKPGNVTPAMRSASNEVPNTGQTAAAGGVAQPLGERASATSSVGVGANLEGRFGEVADANDHRAAVAAPFLERTIKKDLDMKASPGGTPTADSLGRFTTAAGTG